MAVIPTNEVYKKAAQSVIATPGNIAKGQVATGNAASNQSTGQIATPGNIARGQTTGQIATPGNIANGTSGATTGNTVNAMTQNQNAAVPSTQNVPIEDGLKGIRTTLGNYNIHDVGWNDNTKSVTIGGKDYYSPSKIVDGTSYASDKDMYNIINQVYKDKGTSISGVTDYVSSQGISNAVKWSGGQLMVGGQNVPVAYVDDNGTAYAEKGVLDNAIAQYKQQSGIIGNNEIYQNWKNEYGGRIEDALGEITNREKWSYNTENDPAYQAYRDAYTREGNRAYQNAAASMAANTGGYGSSAGVTAGGQQLNYYMQQLGDRVPELMNNSYTRYMGEQELNQAALNRLMGVADGDYNKAYQANRDSINDTNTANYYNYLRDTEAMERNRQIETEDRQWKYQEPILKNQVQQSNYDTSRYENNLDLDLQAKQLANQMSNLQYILSKYQYSGNIDVPISSEDAKAIGMTQKADGTYPTIKEIQEVYARLQAMSGLIDWNENGRQQTIDTWKINNGLY